MILRLAVQIAREKLGIERILVTCDDDGFDQNNVKNGGSLRTSSTDMTSTNKAPLMD
jgi:predicted acetyltransferase